MTVQDTAQAQTAPQLTDREINFRKQEQMFQRQLAAEKARADELERRFEESRRATQQSNDDDDDTSEPYVDHKKLKKEQAKFSQQMKQETQNEIKNAVQQALAEDRKERWLKSNPDFQQVMQLADKFHAKHTELAETILEMPETFERAKLVYKTIKDLGLDKPEVPAATIQQKVDSNRKGPFYQPSGVGTSPYMSQSDFSPQGQKQAFDKLQELKARLRL